MFGNCSSEVVEVVLLELHSIREEGTFLEQYVGKGLYGAAAEVVSVSIDHFIELFTCSNNDQLIRVMPPFIERDVEVDSWLDKRNR